MPLQLRDRSHIVVVDTHPRDYRGLTVQAGEQGWNLHFLTRGRAALQFGAWNSVDLWLINSQLPDFCGIELLRMLHERVATSRVFIVADEYDVLQERAACAFGVGSYLCKGPGRTLDCTALLQSFRGKCYSREPTGDP